MEYFLNLKYLLLIKYYLFFTWIDHNYSILDVSLENPPLIFNK